MLRYTLQMNQKPWYSERRRQVRQVFFDEHFASLLRGPEFITMGPIQVITPKWPSIFAPN